MHRGVEFIEKHRPVTTTVDQFVDEWRELDQSPGSKRLAAIRKSNRTFTTAMQQFEPYGRLDDSAWTELLTGLLVVIHYLDNLSNFLWTQIDDTEVSGT